MKDDFITLTDGSRLDVNVNFATLYYMQKEKLDKLINKKKTTIDDEMELSARLVYLILKSNGRQVTFEEALQLAPIDTEEIGKMLNEFAAKMEKYKKKEDARANMAKNL